MNSIIVSILLLVLLFTTSHSLPSVIKIGSYHESRKMIQNMIVSNTHYLFFFSFLTLFLSVSTPFSLFLVWNMDIFVWIYGHIRMNTFVWIGGLFAEGEEEQENAFRFAIERINDDSNLLRGLTLQASVERVSHQDAFRTSTQSKFFLSFTSFFLS